ncbi:hypothetical protein DYB26_014342 [Aphanomyces astaci]|uniref:Uncharacterized protein n=1 Tax=Aphanomyces astaci TaxID=112090 RepID=A0A397FEP6_APHAT|nr:hypothetical protein DYB31_003586 [Aphanomyces astaci]RHZ40373.1 hypothetical protein DYB26_014342 [Aphanomyces astaci]
MHVSDFAIGISLGSLHRYLKLGLFRPHSNSIRPFLTDANKYGRMKFALDEKWLYLTQESRKYYLVPGEQEPKRVYKSKRDDDLDDHDYSKDQRDSTTSGNPNDDPDTDEYWAENDAADPGRQADAQLGNEVAARHTGKGKGKSKVLPRKFPMPEKRLPPRKDLSSMYMVAQNETTQLKREKFEYMKENYRRIQAAAAVMDLQRAKASFVEKFVASGVVDAEKIRELLSIAFAQE